MATAQFFLIKVNEPDAYIKMKKLFYVNDNLIKKMKTDRIRFRICETTVHMYNSN